MIHMYILVKGECVVVIDGKEVRWQLACRLLSISKLFAECLELHRFVYFCSNVHRFTGGTEKLRSLLSLANSQCYPMPKVGLPRLLRSVQTKW